MPKAGPRSPPRLGRGGPFAQMYRDCMTVAPAPGGGSLKARLVYCNISASWGLRQGVTPTRAAPVRRAGGGLEASRRAGQPPGAFLRELKGWLSNSRARPILAGAPAPVGRDGRAEQLRPLGLVGSVGAAGQTRNGRPHSRTEAFPLLPVAWSRCLAPRRGGPGDGAKLRVRGDGSKILAGGDGSKIIARGDRRLSPGGARSPAPGLAKPPGVPGQGHAAARGPRQPPGRSRSPRPRAAVRALP